MYKIVWQISQIFRGKRYDFKLELTYWFLFKKSNPSDIFLIWTNVQILWKIRSNFEEPIIISVPVDLLLTIFCLILGLLWKSSGGKIRSAILLTLSCTTITKIYLITKGKYLCIYCEDREIKYDLLAMPVRAVKNNYQKCHQRLVMIKFFENPNSKPQ